jgi:hypothetical protein
VRDQNLAQTPRRNLLVSSRVALRFTRMRSANNSATRRSGPHIFASMQICRPALWCRTLG